MNDGGGGGGGCMPVKMEGEGKLFVNGPNGAMIPLGEIKNAVITIHANVNALHNAMADMKQALYTTAIQFSELNQWLVKLLLKKERNRRRYYRRYQRIGAKMRRGR